MNHNASTINASSEDSDLQEEIQSITSHSIERQVVVKNLEVHSTDNDDGCVHDVDGLGAKEQTENSFKNWLLKGRRSRANSATCDIEVEKEDIPKGEGELNQLKNNPSFRRSFKSFFKKEQDISTSSEDSISNLENLVKESDTGDDVTHKETLPLKEGFSADDAINNGHFWRSWRHGYTLRNSMSQISLNNKDTEDDDEIKTLRQTQSRDEMLLNNEMKRRKNMKKLKLQLNDSSPVKEEKLSNDLSPGIVVDILDQSNRYKNQYELTSSSSSMERASVLKDRAQSIFSPTSNLNKDDISPLTPIDDDIIEGAYKFVFETPREYSNYNSNFDSIIVDRKSHVYNIILDILKLVDKDDTSILWMNNPKELTISQVTDEVLKCVKAKILKENLSVNNENLLESKLLSVTTKLQKLEKQYENIKKELTVSINKTESERKIKEDYSKNLNDIYNKFKEINSLYKLSSVDELFEDNQDNFDLLRLDEIIEQVKIFLLEHDQLKNANDKLNKKYLTLQNDHKNLIVSNEILQEKLVTMEIKLKDSAKSSNRGAEGKKQCLEQTLSMLKKANERLTSDYNRERCKVLDLRKSDKVKENYLEAYESYRSESIQFMIYLMHSFRSFVSEEDVAEYNHYIKALNKFTYNVGYADSKNIEKQCKEFVVDMSKFYKEISKGRFVDQLMAKHVSYLLSNEFLSKKLHGLRKENSNYEHYANHLLKELNKFKTFADRQT